MTKHDVSIEIAPEALMSARESRPKSRKLNLRKALFAGVGLLALAGASWLGWQYWTVGQFQVSTDDAYVQADNTTAAPNPWNPRMTIKKVSEVARPQAREAEVNMSRPAMRRRRRPRRSAARPPRRRKPPKVNP